MRKIHRIIKRKAFGNGRMLAIAAAMAIGMCFVTPAETYATQTADSDTVDDEFEDGDQETVASPDAGTDTTSGHTGGSSGSTSGTGSTSGHTTGSSTSGTGSSSGSSSGTATSGTSSSRSSDSSLAHLGISPGTISPAFSAGTHEYTATVDANVTAISVAARPNDSKAVIASVSGAKTLTPGTNTVKVVVSAENGTTTTYTITVNCGSASNTPTDTASDASGDTSADSTSADAAGTVEGEITDGEAADQTEADAGQTADVTFDSNGYLIYEGDAYIPSSMMPEGEYVSLDKYNKLYEQTQAQKSKYMRLVIILAVLLLVACIAILNLALKLRDLRQDARLGLDGIDDEDEDRPVKPARKEKKQEKKPENKRVHKRSDVSASEIQTDMIPDLKLPESMTLNREQPVKTQSSVKAEQPVRTEKTAKPAKPEKTGIFHKKAQDNDDLEILDLNDL